MKKTIFLILALAGWAFGATHYVSSTGTGSWAQSTNIATPCSTRVAFDSAQAGDTALFRGGTYNFAAKNTLNTYRGKYDPAHSGTSEAYIVFKAYPGEIPLMNGTAGGTGDNSVSATIWGVYNQSYIVFDSIRFQSDNGTKMARVMIGYNDAINTRYIKILNCVFNGGDTLVDYTDNAEGLRIERAANVTVSGCTFYNYNESTGNHNTSCIKTYHDSTLLFTHNNIYHFTDGIYLKEDIYAATVRYNWIHDGIEGIFMNAYDGSNPCNFHTYHNNLFSNLSVTAINVYGTGGTFDSLKIYNNTVYMPTTPGEIVGIFAGNQSDYSSSNGQSFYNNIVQGSTRQYTFAKGVIAACDHNQYGNAGGFSVRTNYIGSGTSFTSLDDWHASTAVVGGAHPEDSSETLVGLASDPLFSDSSGTKTLLRDFKLASNSPCKGKGRAGVDMGVNIDSVGPMAIANRICTITIVR